MDGGMLVSALLIPVYLYLTISLDELIAVSDPKIVQAFQNKPFTNPPEKLLEDNFIRDIESVEAFCQRAGLLSEREANEAFQEVLIANLSGDSVGLYSSMHENAVIKYGYGHDNSIRLAYM
jgi:RNA-dependent RNA polymerase